MYKTFVGLTEKDGTFIGESILVEDFDTIADALRTGVEMSDRFIKTITVRKYDTSKSNIIGGINDTGKVVSVKKYDSDNVDSTLLNEVSCDICEVFEEILARNGYHIPDRQRSGDPNESCIYGETYVELKMKITSILRLLTGK